MERVCKNTDELELFAKEVLEFALEHKEAGRAFFLRLKGDLGAGKTTFVKIFSRLLGVGTEVLSPTFVLEKFYNTAHPIFKKLVHIDAYRIDDQKEASILALNEIKSDESAIVCIEWPEKIAESIPENGAIITFEHIDSTTRKVTLDAYV